MKISNDILIYIVEDDQVQSEVLKDKLMLYNSDYRIFQFTTGDDILNHFNSTKLKNKINYIILDYYLQTNENTTTLSGIEIIKLLGEQYPGFKIILFSAYENDDDTNFKELINEPNVIEFVKKSDHAFSRIENIIRFDYTHECLLIRKRRFQWAFAAFVTLLVLSALHFIYSYLSV